MAKQVAAKPTSKAKAKSAPVSKTRRPLAVVFSDAHLQVGAWSSRPKIYGDAYWAFEQICNYAIQLGQPSIQVWSGGDLFDKKINDSRPVNFFCRQLDRLAEFGVLFRFVQGDHDKLDPPWPNAHHNTRWMDGSGCGADRYRLHGLDYRPSGQLQEALVTIPEGTQALLCHQRWTEAHGGLIVCDGSLAEVPHVELVISGDHHKHYAKQVYGADGQTMTLLSPGATCMQAIDEPITHHFYLLYDDLSYESTSLESRPVYATDLIETEDDFERIVAELTEWLPATANYYAQVPGMPEHVQVPLFDVHYSDLVPGVIKRFTELFGEQGHLFFKPYYPETEEHSLNRKQRDAVVSQGLLGCLPLLVPDQTSPLFQGISRLLTAGQQGQLKEELAQQRKEYGLA